MKKERGGGRSVTHLCTKFKIQNFPILDVLLKIKLDVVAATWYLTAATQLQGRDGAPPICSVHIQKPLVMEDKSRSLHWVHD